MVDSWRLHNHDTQLGLQTSHADVVQRPVPIVVIKTTKLLKSETTRLWQSNKKSFVNATNTGVKPQMSLAIFYITL